MIFADKINKGTETIVKLSTPRIICWKREITDTSFAMVWVNEAIPMEKNIGTPIIIEMNNNISNSDIVYLSY
jgi:hypothetical protein